MGTTRAGVPREGKRIRLLGWKKIVLQKWEKETSSVPALTVGWRLFHSDRDTKCPNVGHHTLALRRTDTSPLMRQLYPLYKAILSNHHNLFLQEYLVFPYGFCGFCVFFKGAYHPAP